MTYSRSESDEKNGDSDNENAPTPTVEWGGNDDDEPPATGGAVIVESDNSELEISMAPTAEPEHRAKPNEVMIA